MSFASFFIACLILYMSFAFIVCFILYSLPHFLYVVYLILYMSFASFFIFCLPHSLYVICLYCMCTLSIGYLVYTVIYAIICHYIFVVYTLILVPKALPVTLGIIVWSVQYYPLHLDRLLRVDCSVFSVLSSILSSFLFFFTLHSFFFTLHFCWDWNPQPLNYKAVALTTQLSRAPDNCYLENTYKSLCC